MGAFAGRCGRPVDRFEQHAGFVIRAILGMAKSFRLETIAEGVEDENQMRCLHRYGCEEGQGYLFGKPVSAMEFGEMFGLGLTRRMAAR